MAQPKILIVISDEIQLENFSAVFNYFGFEITKTSSGIQSMELLKNNPWPDVLLLDSGLKAISVNELDKQMKLINKQWEKLPIVCFSSSLQYRLLGAKNLKTILEGIDKKFQQIKDYTENIPGDILTWVNLALEQNHVPVPKEFSKVVAVLDKI